MPGVLDLASYKGVLTQPGPRAVIPVENRTRNSVAQRLRDCRVNDHLGYPNDLRLWKKEQMKVSGISNHRVGTIYEVAPPAGRICRRLK